MSPLFSQASAAAEAFVPPAVVQPAGIGDDAILIASQALEAEATVPGMVRPFLAHQAAAYLYCTDAIARWGCALLGDDMGMGKTQVELALIADAIADGGYAILVGPPVALGTYETELAAAFPGLTMAHLFGRTRKALPVADVYFLNDDAGTLAAWLTDGKDEAGHYQPSSIARNAEIFVRDEIHRDKGNQGKPTARARVSLLLGQTLRAAGKPVVIATGTLLTNRPVEAFLPLQIAGGDELVKAVTPNANTKTRFLYYYCSPTTSRFGTDFGGCDMGRMAQLHERLRRTVYVRREREDLGDLLPHGGWIVAPLALNGTMDRYRRIERDFLALVLEEKGPDSYWKAARAQAIVQMNMMRQEAGVAKAGAAAEYVRDLVDQGKSVLVFYVHTAVRDAVAKHLVRNKAVNLVTIDGSTSKDGRKDAEAAIQNGSANVCLAQIQAAGVAITLTAASEAVFVQVPWSAGDLAQAAARIKRTDAISIERARRGESVHYHVLQACHADGRPTFDAAIWDVLERKAQVCDAVNAGRDITLPEESILEQALTEWVAQANRPW